MIHQCVLLVYLIMNSLTARFYCTLKAVTDTPASTSEGGGKCGAGTKCPQGSSEAQDCTPGTVVKLIKHLNKFLFTIS